MFELNIVEITLYFLTGTFAGFTAGLLGIGGGLIVVPILYFIFSTQGYEQQYLMHMALATSLATIITTSISSTFSHHKKRAVLWPVVLRLSPSICLGAWLGVTFAIQLNSAILKPIFGAFEIFVAVLMFSQYQRKKHNHTITSSRSFLGGSTIGTISSIVGIGGGTLTVPFLYWHNITIKNAIASSAACGLPIAIFATASYIINGWGIAPNQPAMFSYIQLHAFIIISISSFLFAPVGAKLSHTFSDNVLKKIFSLTLLLLGLKMLLS